ncbi:thiamine biosynthesis lipoprotein apbE precursor [Chlamydia felis Fe/C-56]|uniref:FAD:protein FMN transferase n=1 Tax=Chlamydia felis (strain Fe/C-56) TaxID=264202 RepID=Q254F6_CHLFF|nr:FAD:protein FMN transferase [Chlamydia felis]BAE81332.1 thiamine biosynthesis lipoprotein apbE precursor [Chlamydia felis Fe/C-56]
MGKLSKILLITLLSWILQGCSPKLTTLEGERMTIPYRIVIGKRLSNQETEQLKKEVNTVFHVIDTIYNNWNRESELSKINRSPANVAIPLSKELLAFLKQVDTFYQLSGGRFDPTLGPLKNLWLLHLKQHSLPNEQTWKTYYENTGWEHISIDFTNQTITKQHADIQLDLCGAVKGFAVDCLLETCQRFCTNSYAEWGGEIKTSGRHPTGRPWRIASSATTKIIELNNTAVATSGNYHQQWSIEGKIYTHILDPRTGKPLELHDYPIVSATVIHSSCAFADAMATVLMTFSTKAEALAWAQKNNIEAFINDNAS